MYGYNAEPPIAIPIYTVLPYCVIHFVIYSLTPFFCVLTIHYNADQMHVYEPEILHVNRCSSKLVHRYIIYSLTPFFCVLTIHYNAGQIHVKTPMNIACKPVFFQASAEVYDLFVNPFTSWRSNTLTVTLSLSNYTMYSVCKQTAYRARVDVRISTCTCTYHVVFFAARSITGYLPGN